MTTHRPTQNHLDSVTSPAAQHETRHGETRAQQQPRPGPAAVDPASSPSAAVAPTALGWDDGWREAAATQPAARTGPTTPGRVARTDRGRCLVRTADAEIHAELLPGLDPEPTTGDWVLIDDQDHVVAALPRRTALVRGAGGRDTRAQVLAANLDVVFIVVPLSSAPNLSRLERMLAVAWSSGARPVVLLSKADLAATAAAERDQVAQTAPGVDVLLVSTMDGTGMEDVAALLPPGSTGALLGVSGAGKSSLVNALVGSDLLAVDRLAAVGKGQHTSVTRELVALPGGALLIDTPGLRGVQMWDTEEGLEQTFTDVIALTESCRFADCGHDTEPDCAVTAALTDGTLPPRRWDSFRKLQREQTWLASRYDARLRAEQRAVWKRRQTEGRSARRR